MISQKILIVDDEPNNLQILRQILKNHYSLIFANNGEKALAAAKQHKPDIILLDIMMPEMNGYEVCQRLKADKETADIPVLFVTAMNEVDDEKRGFDVGGVDYITKPISGEIVLRRVRTHLSLVKAEALERLSRAAIIMLGDACHYNDTDTGDHIWRMAAYARILADGIGWPEHLLDIIELAAVMHDTGKVGIPHEILKAPRALTEEEWVIMKNHTQIGYDILSKSDTPVFKMAAKIAIAHHEKWDGSGYPQGLVGKAIPEVALIIALVDVFDALTMKRPYKEAWSVEDAIIEIRKNSGSHFEPRLVDIFEKRIAEIIEIKERFQNKIM
ncbi:MAG: response regulator [Psychrobium sp.]|nr:response regulator [Psychrobium sp.]